eukprot:SAG11_NODE_34084_length_274_cov_0.520000_1_plen_38_part_01
MQSVSAILIKRLQINVEVWRRETARAWWTSTAKAARSR